MHDKRPLPLQNVPRPRVEGVLGDVGVDGYLVVHVALTECAPLALLHVAGTLWGVEVMQCHDAVLHVHAHAHFPRTANQDTDFPGFHVVEELIPLLHAFGVVDKRDFFRRNAHAYQDVFQVLINGHSLGFLYGVQRGFRLEKLRLRAFRSGGRRRFRRRVVTEDNLRPLAVGGRLPRLRDDSGALHDFPFRLVGQRMVHDALGVRDFPPVVPDFQNIVHFRVNVARFEFFGAARQIFHVGKLVLAGFALDDNPLATLHFRDFEAGNLRHHVHELLKHLLQCVEVEVAGEGVFEASALPGGADLQFRPDFRELVRPRVEVVDSARREGVGL